MAALTSGTADQQSTAEPQSTEARVGRRSFTKEYKQRILAEADACKHGEVGLLLRREGLYHATLAGWRKQLALSGEGGLGGQKRGRKAAGPTSLKADNERLKKELARATARLVQVELINDVQKKLCQVLGLTPVERDL